MNLPNLPLEVFLSGELDVFAKPEHLKKEAQVSGSSIEYATIEGAGHLDLILGKVAVNTTGPLILDFINRIKLNQ
jgi:hypothetical protein